MSGLSFFRSPPFRIGENAGQQSSSQVCTFSASCGKEMAATAVARY